MELKGIKNKLSTLFSKYKYVVLILIIGIILMNIPIKTNFMQETKAENESQPEDIHIFKIEDELSNILSNISGVGKVAVMITEKTGENTIYQTNDDLTTNNENQSSRFDTVTVTSSDRSETGLVKQVNPPQYLGAVIVCEGADEPTVKLSVIDAVSKATGLKSSNISVLKMK